MQKLVVFLVTILIATLLISVYSIAQGLIIYSISPEFYTEIKFLQSDYNPLVIGSNHERVAALEFFSNWWIGLIIGAVVGFTAMIYERPQNMTAAIRDAFLVIFCTIIFFNFIVFLIAKFFWAKTDATLKNTNYIPNRDDFIAAGYVHNLSYIAVIAGVILAIIYILRKKSRLIER